MIETVQKLGVNPKSIALAMLVGQNVGTIVNPCIPTTFLAVGLAGVELKDHIKFTLKYLVLISVILVVAGILIGFFLKTSSIINKGTLN